MQKQIQHKFFGLLKYGGSMPGRAESYGTTLEFSSGEIIELTIDATNVNEQDVPVLIERARTAYLALQQKREDLLHTIANHFVIEHNRDTIQRVHLSEDKFLCLLQFHSIYIGQDGSSSLFFMPKGLEEYLGDHGINVDVDSRQRITFIE